MEETLVSSSQIAEEKSYSRITRTEGVCGGEPAIGGTRITVSLIATLEKMGHSADEIVDMCPHINHAQVFSALAYYYDNRAEVDRLIASNDIDYWEHETRGAEWRTRSST